MSGDSLYLATRGRGPEVVLLHGLGTSSRYWESLAAAGLPVSIASDGARRTWASSGRTLLRVAVEHRAPSGLLDAPAPAMLLHGRHHRSAPVRMAENLVARSAELRRLVRLETVGGGHHLDVRQLEVVGAALDRKPATGVTP